MTRTYEERRDLTAALRTRKAEVAAEVTAAFLAGHPDWLDRYGDLARVRGEEDAAFHVEFLAGAVLADDPDAFRDYARWTAGVLAARGIAPEFLVENLEQVRDAVTADLAAAERSLVAGMVSAGIDTIREDGGASGPTESGGGAYGTERSLYLQAVRAGQRQAAVNVALETLRAGASVPDIYRWVLQPVQYRIGQLWEWNEITVAEEHMATAITQYVMSHLYSHLEVSDPWRGTAVVTGVEGELHQLGGEHGGGRAGGGRVGRAVPGHPDAACRDPAGRG